MKEDDNEVLGWRLQRIWEIDLCLLEDIVPEEEGLFCCAVAIVAN